ncbi:LVIVD repeat-containing protein [Pseudonocardia alaniniphila]|uniref:LVIVD repeat-containing protein n=1 Tax=Pseudonocardia alaniniphila TaxID=75291 RepID=A0ABS9TRI6_9PSEU|nr:hypothetical protein [Pseudonocardia alaniniphila]MCH6171170.1 hypothetical protein [Pseudonocardia alaniniphila]
MSTPAVEIANAFTPLGRSDQGGRPDAMQLQYQEGYVYVGHLFSGGFSVVDARNPRDMTTVGFHAAPPDTWNIHLQAADDLLLVIHAKDLWKEFSAEQNYYQGSVGTRLAGTRRTWSAGVAMFDISNPAEPRQISFLDVDGVGVHRLWYTGGRWAYASVLAEGFTDYVFRVIDLKDPAKPRWAGEWWLPGMNSARGESPTWDTGRWRYALHHAIIDGDTAYASWRDGGLTLLDIRDREAPELISHRNWSPPFGGGTHPAVPLPARELLLVADEATADNLQDGLKHVWVFTIADPTNPISIATLPTPAEQDYARKGGHFGPHNLHENRPGSFVSDTLIFATYQNAGVRSFDISDPYRPKPVGALLPGPPAKLMDPRPGRPCVIQTADVHVRPDGVLFCTDYNAGLLSAQYDG